MLAGREGGRGRDGEHGDPHFPELGRPGTQGPGRGAGQAPRRDLLADPGVLPQRAQRRRGGEEQFFFFLFVFFFFFGFRSSVSRYPRYRAMLPLAGAELAAAARAGGGAGEEGGGAGGGGGRRGTAALSSPRFFAFAALTAAAVLGLVDPAAGFAVGWALWVLTEAWDRGTGLLRRAWRERRRKKKGEEEREQRPTRDASEV